MLCARFPFLYLKKFYPIFGKNHLLVLGEYVTQISTNQKATMLSIANGGCASSSARGVVAARSVSEARRRGGKKTRRAAASLMSSSKSNSTSHKREEEDKNVFAKVAATTALAFTMITAPPPSFAAFDSKTSQSLADDAKEYRVELSGSSQGVTGSIKINSKLNRSLQETVTFDFSDVKGLAPNTKHGINIHDETTGKSWNPGEKIALIVCCFAFLLHRSLSRAEFFKS